MAYPSQFYYSLKRSEPQYTYRPTGNLNVPRMIQNKSYWRKPASKKIANKKLVLADWTAGQWEKDKINQIDKIIQQLQADGFEIYVWQENEVVPLKKNTLDEEMRKKIKPAHHDTIIAAAATQYRLTKDEIQIVDDYWLQALLDQQFDQPREVDLRYLPDSSQDKEAAISVLQHAKPSVETLKHTSFSDKDNKNAMEAEKLIPGKQINHDYHFVEISFRQALDLIFNETITNNNLTLNLTQWAKIKNLILDNTGEEGLYKNISSHSFIQLIKSIEAINSLTLGGMGIQFSNDQLKQCDLHSLKYFTLINCDISDESLKGMLLLANNLEELALLNVKINEVVHDVKLNSTSLKKLRFYADEHHDLNISSDFLKDILPNPNVLRVIEFEKYRVLGDNIKDIHLKLEEFSIKKTEISLGLLQNMLLDSSLKRLTISLCKLEGDLNAFLESINASKLENITLKRPHSKSNKQDYYGGDDDHPISEDALKNILTDNLKELYLSDLTLQGNISGISLNSLEKLDLKGVELSAETLAYILKNAPNLKELRISHCLIDGDHSVFDNLNLQSWKLLETLTLNECYSIKLLKGILSGISNAKDIKLTNCYITGDLSNKMNLLSVNSLNLEGSTLSENSLKHLLSHARNLKFLSFKPSREITNDLEAGSLQELILDCETIYDKNYFEKSLQHIFHKGQNIKKLKLSKIYKIKNEKYSKTFSLSSLEELFLDRVNLSGTQFSQLFSNSVNLKKIILRNHSIGNDIGDCNYTSLTELIISSTTISTNSLYEIIHKANHLKKLDIDWIRGRETIDFPKPLNLHSLEDVTLRKIYISAKTLLSLLEDAIHLKHLVLDDCKIIYDDLADSLALHSKMTYLKKAGVSVVIQSIKFMTVEEKQIEDDPLKQIGQSAALEKQSVPSLSDAPLKEALAKLLIDTYERNLGRPSQNKGKNSPFPSSLPTEEGMSEATDPDHRVSNRQAPLHREANASATVSADTRDIPSTYKLNKLFWSHGATDPHPADYRMSVYHRLGLSDEPVTIDRAFTLYNEQDLQLDDNQPAVEKSDVDVETAWRRKSSDLSLYYGKMQLYLNDQWQALPSLSSNDKMLKYHLDSPLATCEIKYSKRDNLYYIKAAKHSKVVNQPVTIDFLLESHPPQHKNRKIPADLERLINNYSTFKENKDKTKNTIKQTSRAFLDEINESRTGKCDQRSIALMDAIQHPGTEVALSEGIACRAVGNDCHMYVEIKLQDDDAWVRYDLGGYDADLEINNEYRPDKTPLDSHNIKENDKQALNEVAQDAVPNLSDQTNVVAVEEPKSTVEDANDVIASRPGFNIVKETEKKEDEMDLAYFERAFETWEKEKPLVSNPLMYYQALTSGIKQKQLIELSSNQQVQALALALENHAHHTSRPVYYIHSPDDLVCSTPHIKRAGHEGEILSGDENGQGGPLHDFLTATYQKNNPPILIVNYNNFEADDLVRLNNVLDDKDPKADGTPIHDARIIGLINSKKPDCYQGEDFYSRFGKGNVSTVPFTTDELRKDLIVDIENRREDQAEVYDINLFHAEDWQERLLGRWQIKKDRLIFQEGLLTKALQSGLPISIQNGPWEDESFCHFMNRLRTLPEIIANEESFKGKNITFVKQAGYLWENLRNNITFDNSMQPDAQVLNHSLFVNYFSRYECNDKKQLDTLIGLIANAKGTELHVNLTGSLNDDEWAELLTACNQHRVILRCHVAPLVTIPQVLGEIEKINPALSLSGNTVIKSTDVDVTVIQLKEQNRDAIVIDVSELNANDLLYRLTGNVIKIQEGEKEKHVFEFNQTLGALEKALSENKHVILRGRLSPELADELAPLLLKNHPNIHVVTADVTTLNYLDVTEHRVTAEEKKQALLTMHVATQDEIDKLSDLDQMPFCHARARLFSSNVKDLWYGLYGLSGGIQLDEFDPSTSKAVSDNFIRDRIDGIKEKLSQSPYVFITGLTGVGKSTFIKKYFSNKEKPLYIGEENLKKWALDQSEGDTLLFLDEVNLSNREWSELRGLYDIPPGIMCHGEYLPLSKNHKIIVAGNPLNYGDERVLAPVFEENPSVLEFKPMPSAFIYEYILKPIFNNTNLQKYEQPISEIILQVYKFLCDRSADEVLISPRELEMMALLILSRIENHPDDIDDIESITRHYVNLIARNLLPKQYLNEFDQSYPDPGLDLVIEKKPPEFVITDSRKPLYRHMTDLLELREYRRKLAKDTPDAINREPEKLFGGLGGVVIEGEPGIGKTEIVIEHLVAHGYQEVKLTKSNDKDIAIPENAFCRMGISMSYDEKKYVLETASEKGLVVIVDEVNSAPMMEKLLNDLLMGRKANGDRPDNPGFMIIGTQNPADKMEGRGKASNALKRRVTTIELPIYPDKELKEIVNELGLDNKYESNMITAFKNQVARAKRDRLKPAPIIRDFLRVAKAMIAKVGKKLYAQKDKQPVKHAERKKAAFSDTKKVIPLVTTITTTTTPSLPPQTQRQKQGKTAKGTALFARQDISSNNERKVIPTITTTTTTARSPQAQQDQRDINIPPTNDEMMADGKKSSSHFLDEIEKEIIQKSKYTKNRWKTWNAQVIPMKTKSGRYINLSMPFHASEIFQIIQDHKNPSNNMTVGDAFKRVKAILTTIHEEEEKNKSRGETWYSFTSFFSTRSSDTKAFYKRWFKQLSDVKDNTKRVGFGNGSKGK